MMDTKQVLLLLGKSAIGAIAFCTAVTSIAAQQCIASAGTYGAVTVTQSAGCMEPGFNPFDYEGMTGFGLGTNLANTAGVVCTLGFSHPVATSSVSIDLSGHNPLDDITLSTSAGPYLPVNADLNPTPLPTSPSSPLPLFVAGNAIVTSGIAGSGTFHFTNSPPSSITSLTINHMSQGFGTFIRVCLDDAAPVAANANPVPTLSEWSFALMALALGGVAMVTLRRRS